MISFIVPVYNGENYLRPCLDSILSQSVRDIEVICVNDGSTDASQKILEEYAATDARVQVVRQANGGVSAARNHGMELAKGEYIWFFDCDDVLHPGAAQAMLARAQNTGAQLVLGNYQFCQQESSAVRPSGQKIGTTVWAGDGRLQAAHFSALCGCKLWRADFLRKNGLRFWPYRLAEDVAFYLCGLACCDMAAGLDCTVYDYRVYSGSSCRSYALAKEKERIEVFDRIDAFYRQHGGLEAFRRELLFDRMFHYNLAIASLPRYGTRGERHAVYSAYIAARQQLDFAAVQDRADIMAQVQKFDRMAKRRAVYESDLYAFAYRTGRAVKNRLNRSRK